jgi:hypothetical protein
MPFLLACVVLPLLMMMARSIPAIALTDDYLINNYGGFSIEWHDILEIHRTKSYRGSGGIVINLKNPEKYFDSPIKKISYQLRQLFSANDITIPLNLVAGNDDEILQTITAYWNKNAR